MKILILENGSIQLKPVTEDDLELLMAWRSHPEVYRYFTVQREPLIWKEHLHFWRSRKDRIDWIINYDDGTHYRKVGSVNAKALSGNSPEVGVFIGETTLMGKGIGRKSVLLVVRWLKSKGHKRVLAHISKENLRSQRLFYSLGFEKIDETDDSSEWTYELLLDDELQE